MAESVEHVKDTGAEYVFDDDFPAHPAFVTAAANLRALLFSHLQFIVTATPIRVLSTS